MNTIDPSHIEALRRAPTQDNQDDFDNHYWQGASLRIMRMYGGL